MGWTSCASARGEMKPGSSAYDAVIAITVILSFIFAIVAGYYVYIWYQNKIQSNIAFDKWVRGSASLAKGSARSSGFLNGDNGDVLIVENPMMKRNSVLPNSGKNVSPMMTKVGDESGGVDPATIPSIRRLSGFFSENSDSPSKRGPLPNNVATIRRSSMSGNNSHDSGNDEVINIPSIFIPAVTNESANRRMSARGETPVKVNLKSAQDDL